MLLVGLSMLAVTIIWISQATVSEGCFASLIGPLLLFGIGAGCRFLPLSVTILFGVPRDGAGAASGMLQTTSQTGAALGVAALTSVAASHGRSDALQVGGVIVIVALLVAVIAIRPSTGCPPTAEEAEEMAPIALVE